MALSDLIKMARCPHANRSGGNDYIYCADCGLTWDYRRPPEAWMATAHAEIIKQLAGVTEGDTDPLVEREAIGWTCACGHPNGLNLATCACCSRAPGGPDNPVTTIYHTRRI